MAHTYEYPRPAVTVDCVIFGKSDEDTSKVLLIERANPPFEGQWALPGGFVDEQEAAEVAAQRELEEETGLKRAKMQQLHAFSTPYRDPRGWTISIAYYAVVNMTDCKVQAADDARKAEWVSLSEAKNLAFDHEEILAKAIEALNGNF